MALQTYKHPVPFTLENGKTIHELEIAFHTYGQLNHQKNNVIWVSHALTANADVFDWWPGLFGDTGLFNPNEYFIVCPNVLGSPYGTTNPLSINPVTQKPYFLSFPQYTIRDMTGIHKILANHLKIAEIHTLIGGSLGGQQALEWVIDEPERIKNVILLATNAFHSPWGIAFNESQRLAISTDPTFHQQIMNGGQQGLKTARSIALLSYRNYSTYDKTQREDKSNKTDDYKASSYQCYQGEKLVKRFNAYSYWYLTKAMDSHHIGRNREPVEQVLAKIKANTLIMGIYSDLLFPINEQEYLAKHIPDSHLVTIDSMYGHDGFLIETPKLSREIKAFLEK